MRKIRRFIAARGRSGCEVARQKVGTIGLEHQPLARHLWHECGEVRAATLIADPAGDADRQTELQIALQLLSRAGEAVSDAAPARGVLAQYGDEIIVRVALVQEYRLANLRGELELAVERLLLRRAGREVAEIIEPALSDRDHLGNACELSERGKTRGIELRGVVRMNPRGGEESLGILACESQRAHAARECRAGDHHLHDAGRARPRDHGITIAIVAVVCEVDADVDQPWGRGDECRRCCAMVRHVWAYFTEWGNVRRTALTDGSALRRPGRRQPSLPVVAAALALAVSAARADDVAWRDVESRIQYGYYTEDSAALRKLEELIAAGDTRDKLRGYYAGLLDWRRAQLAAPGAAAAERGNAARYAEQCVSEVDNALALDADFAEALALRAACLTAPQEISGGYAPIAGHRARKDLERARQLAARNPRVLLVDATSDYELLPAQGGNKERALGKLRQTVAAFEAERSDTDHLPGWGAAEAWLLLARDLLDHGDPVGARDALEHALLIAPEYAQARRLMAKITSG